MAFFDKVKNDEEVEIERAAEECVLYLLSHHMKNSPIKRPELVKAVIPDQSRRNVKAILDRTKELLKAIHGLKLVELDENVKQLILVNAIESGDQPINWSDEARKEQAILLPILSFIFMNGGTATESELKVLLKKLKVISSETYDSQVFDDVEKIIKKEFVHQRYLHFETSKLKNRTDEEKEIEFSWGSRSDLEVSKEKILKFVSELYGVEITHWADQYALLGK